VQYGIDGGEEKEAEKEKKEISIKFNS